MVRRDYCIWSVHPLGSCPPGRPLGRRRGGGIRHDVLCDLKRPFTSRWVHRQGLMRQTEECLITTVHTHDPGSQPLRIGDSFKQPRRVAHRGEHQKRVAWRRMGHVIRAQCEVGRGSRGNLPPQQAGDKVRSAVTRRFFTQVSHKVPRLPVRGADDKEVVRGRGAAAEGSPEPTSVSAELTQFSCPPPHGGTREFH